MSDLQKNFLLIFLGDIARSPWMCNHAQELSDYPNSQVYIMCYKDSKVPMTLWKDNIQVNEFSSNKLELLKKLPVLLYFFIRVIFEVLQLIHYLY